MEGPRAAKRTLSPRTYERGALLRKERFSGRFSRRMSRCERRVTEGGDGRIGVDQTPSVLVKAQHSTSQSGPPRLETAQRRASPRADPGLDLDAGCSLMEGMTVESWETHPLSGLSGIPRQGSDRLLSYCSLLLLLDAPWNPNRRGRVGCRIFVGVRVTSLLSFSGPASHSSGATSRTLRAALRTRARRGGFSLKDTDLPDSARIVYASKG